MAGPFDLYDAERDHSILAGQWERRGVTLDPHTGHTTVWGQSGPGDAGARVSWNQGDGSGIHLTDQNCSRGDPGRHPFDR